MRPSRQPQEPRRRASERESGFTLIELLVVITILGILAAIVVFAVRGIGDKGRASAVKADANVLRTAEETNCAQHGTYAKASDLVANKLLASGSAYNEIALGDGGNCGTGSGSSFSLYPAQTSVTADSVPLGTAAPATLRTPASWLWTRGRTGSTRRTPTTTRSA